MPAARGLRVVQLGLLVGQVAPGDEDGDGGEDHISALQGHNRAGSARSGILGLRVQGAGGLVSAKPSGEAWAADVDRKH
jgi:hypothetical protein